MNPICKLMRSLYLIQKNIKIIAVLNDTNPSKLIINTLWMEIEILNDFYQCHLLFAQLHHFYSCKPDNGQLCLPQLFTHTHTNIIIFLYFSFSHLLYLLPFPFYQNENLSCFIYFCHNHFSFFISYYIRDAL